MPFHPSRDTSLPTPRAWYPGVAQKKAKAGVLTYAQNIRLPRLTFFPSHRPIDYPAVAKPLVLSRAGLAAKRGFEE
jgi:hypothetical protein